MDILTGRGVNGVDAGFFEAEDVVGVGVDELHDDYAADVFQVRAETADSSLALRASSE